MALLLYIIEKIDIYERGNRNICLFLFTVLLYHRHSKSRREEGPCRLELGSFFFYLCT
jgi:hypothetical protein